MHHSDTIAALRTWEEQFPVHLWTVGGIHVWPLIRNRLASKLLAVGRPKVRQPFSPSHRARQAAQAAAARFRHRRAARILTADAVFLSRPSNRQFVNGVWYDRFFDPIAEILELQGHASLHLEYRPDGGVYRAARHRPAMQIRAAVTRRNLAAALQCLHGAELSGFPDLAGAVRREFPTVAMVSPRWVARQARSLELLARYFDRVMREAHARLAFCSVYYNLVGMAFCLAAKRRGIASIDVQHGVTAGNPAYEGWTRFPEGGYAVLPSTFWCWSEADARPVRGWPTAARPHHHAMVGGHPWFALWRSNHPLAEDLRRRAGTAPPNASLRIVVTLSWSTGFSPELRGLMKAAPRDWVWWIRLHPLMGRERSSIRAWCERHLRGHSEVDSATDLPLPLLLERADLHLTHNSTVVQEAARSGVPSVVIDPHALDVYKEELASGWAMFAEHPRAILAAVTAQHQRRRLLKPLPTYPSWSDLSTVLRELLTGSTSCCTTAPAAFFPTRAQA